MMTRCVLVANDDEVCVSCHLLPMTDAVCPKHLQQPVPFVCVSNTACRLTETVSIDERIMLYVVKRAICRMQMRQVLGKVAAV